jgi:putative DNA primase/helicase
MAYGRTAKRARKNPLSFPLTDSGNAELIAERFGDRLRFDHRRDRWLIWKGTYWAEDGEGEIFRLAKEAARARLKSASKLASDVERKEAIKWAIKSESRYCLHAALELAKHTIPIADPGDNWDLDPLLLGVPNGVVDLLTGELRKACPEDRITLKATTIYDPSTLCPQFVQFLRQIFMQDDELIRYVQKAIGYSLTGEVKEQCLFLCYGEGANGKSTLLEAVRSMLGDYAHNLPFSAFELGARSGVSNDIAGIVAKRFVTAVETSENVAFNEGRIKALTGGDQSTARLLYHEHFSFTPTSKFWLAFNHRPRVTDDSHGFWRRVRLIPFLARFDGADDDKNLGAKLRSEAAGILAWAIQGALLWRAEGLGMPPAVLEASTLYKTESDSLGMFIEDSYDLCLDGVVKSAELSHDHAMWARENGEQALNARSLATRLRARGIESIRVGQERTRAWRGLRRKITIPSTLAEDTRTEADTIVH